MLSVNKLMSALPIPSVLISNTERSGSPLEDLPEHSDHNSSRENTASHQASNTHAVKRNDSFERPEGAEERTKERRGSASAALRLSTTASKSRTLSSSYNESAIDPLSFQILRRTGTDNALQQKPSKDIREEKAEDTAATMHSPETTESPTVWRKNGEGILFSGPLKEKRKGVSFLSKLIGGSKRKGDLDNESIDGDRRTEGDKAHVFSQPIGYIPTLPPPPKYIKVRTVNKITRDFGHVFLSQELWSDKSGSTSEEPISNGQSQQRRERPQSSTRQNNGAVWTMKFSKDGQYLATGGQDKIVRVWAVISSPADRSAHEVDEEAIAGASVSERDNVKLTAPVFRSQPIKMYAGHTADVLDMSWSKNNFLLSSSMDKTVRLWHVSRAECLSVFQHTDFVTSIRFHPRDDRFFLAGSLDHNIRLWSIPDNTVVFQAEVQDIITAVEFSPDGKQSIAGCLNGVCHIFDTDKLKPAGHIFVRSTHGRNAKGSKITGIETMDTTSDKGDGFITKMLVTSNDSRVRIYNMKDKTLDVKLKGLENTCSQIRASFSDDASFIICGSEDKKVYIWDRLATHGRERDKRPYEYFEAHSTIVTNAVLAPASTRELLALSRDPTYDLCNPPPVTLVSLSELENGQPHTSDSVSIDESLRSSHPKGNIIVTSDITGSIKVFRQDCAASKRAERSETASILSRHLTGVSRRSSVRSWRKSIGGRISFEQSQQSLREER